jgi:hypothetical protein
LRKKVTFPRDAPGRRKAAYAAKGIVEMENIAKAAKFRYFLDFVAAALEHIFRVANPYLRYVLMYRFSGLLLEQVAKVHFV